MMLGGSILSEDFDFCEIWAPLFPFNMRVCTTAEASARFLRFKTEVLYSSLLLYIDTVSSNLLERNLQNRNPYSTV